MWALPIARERLNSTQSGRSCRPAPPLRALLPLSHLFAAREVRLSWGNGVDTLSEADDRTPVIIAPADYQLWLTGSAPRAPKGCSYLHRRTIARVQRSGERAQTGRCRADRAPGGDRALICS